MAGLYIHVPFCHAKCWYCDFYSLVSNERSNDYVDCLEREWNMRCYEIPTPETIYLGGGTPSILPVSAVKRLGEWLPGIDGEFTVEMNPEDVSQDVVAAWRGIGVNRVSMGVQSLNDVELSGVGRRHTARQAIEAYNILRDEGITNISLDLIIGLPGQSRASLGESVERLLDLRPEHFSAYILSYEQGTRLWARRQAGKVVETDDDTLVEMYGDVCRKAADYGYDHYEISNFALPGHRARHNAAYWGDVPYLGLGPAAHSFDGRIRRANPGNLKLWIDGLKNGKTVYTVENETIADRVNDRIMVALRTSAGLDMDSLDSEYRAELERNLASLPDGRVLRNGSRLYIPESAWPLSDDTIATLFVE